jgi:hypothetical protein
MDQIQQLQQQLALAKARGFDLYQQCENQGQYIQMLDGVLKQIAQKLGVTSDNLQLNDIFAALDRLIKVETTEPAKQSAA